MQALNMVGQSLLAGAAMAWQVLWSLVLGFTLSGMIQAYVSRQRMMTALGRVGLKEIALATGLGAASRLARMPPSPRPRACLSEAPP